MEAYLQKIFEVLRSWYDFVLKSRRPVFKKGQCVKVKPGQQSGKEVTISIPDEYADSFTVKIWPGYQFFTANKSEGKTCKLLARIIMEDGGGSESASTVFIYNISTLSIEQGNAAATLPFEVPMMGGAYRAQGSGVIVQLFISTTDGAILERDVYVSICKGAPKHRIQSTEILKVTGTDKSFGIPRFATGVRLSIMDNFGRSETLATIGDFQFLSFTLFRTIYETEMPYFCEWVTFDTLGAVQEMSNSTMVIPIPTESLACLLDDVGSQSTGVYVSIEWHIFE